jgi:hypothetical protein
MNNITGFTFFKNYYESIKGINEEDKKDILLAVVEFVFDNIEPNFEGIKQTVWLLMKPYLITSKNRSNNAKSKQNQNKIKIKSKVNQTPSYSYSYSYSKLGNYKRIILTNKQYEKLIKDYNKEFIDNQINLLDEYIQSNNNKNKYTDFNLVLRKSIRENWFNNKTIKEPEWFNKKIEKEECSEEEKEELKNLLKNFK